MNKYLTYAIVIAVAALAGAGAYALFTQPATDNNENRQTNESIKVVTPKPLSVINSPLSVTGEAKGNWYFEATFPISIEDEDGNVLGQSYVTAQEDWMSEGFVDFAGKIEFEEPQTATGYLILEKANASGLPEHAEEVRVKIRF